MFLRITGFTCGTFDLELVKLDVADCVHDSAPPNLIGLKHFSETTWVHNASGSKLDVRAWEGHWIGFDTESHGHHVYWPVKGTVSVEQNIYFGAGQQLEGEPLAMPTFSTLTEQPPAPAAPELPDPPSTPEAPVLTPPVSIPRRMRMPTPPAPPSVHPTHACIPSCIVHDLQSGMGTLSARPSNPTIPQGIAILGSFTEEDKVDNLIGGAWAEDDIPGLEEDCNNLEQILVAETADTEALKPRSLAEAHRCLEWAQWERAIKEEIATLKAAGTWCLEELPPGANVIGSKWVFKAKKDASRQVVCYKACLVTQGFSQIDGIDYDDTYAPIARLTSTRTILTLANRLDMELQQFDVKATYLNRELTGDEVLFMHHPPGYNQGGTGRTVLCLQKVLYGLKQVGHRWYQTLVWMLTDLGFAQCSVNQAVFHKVMPKSGQHIIVVVHVDDFTVAADSMALIDAFSTSLRKHVELMDLGKLHWMLSLEVKHNCEAGQIHISQHTYIDSILRGFGFDELKPLSTPFDTQVCLTHEQAPATTEEFALMCDVPYREAIGMLNWAALAMCPDIAFTVLTMARFSANPGLVHWDAVKRIFHYLAGTCDLWLSYGETRHVLEGFVDTNGSMTKDRCAVSGYTFLIDGGAVSWLFKKQELVSPSTTESEYVTATHGIKEALWLHSLLVMLQAGWAVRRGHMGVLPRQQQGS